MPLRLGHPNPSRRLRLESSIRASLLAYLTLIFGLALWGGLSPVNGQTSMTALNRAEESAILAIIYGGVLCLIGWLGALPLVLSLRQLFGVGLWIMLLAGIALGPTIVLLIPALYSLFTPHMNFTYSTLDRVFWHLVYLALAVSTVTTFVYVLLLGRQSTQPGNA